MFDFLSKPTLHPFNVTLRPAAFLLRLANFLGGRRCALVKIGALLRVAVAQIYGAGRSPLAYLDGCPCSASAVSAASSASAPQPAAAPCFVHWTRSPPLPRRGSGPLTVPFAGRQRGLFLPEAALFLILIESHPPPIAVPPALRARPHTGALGHRLLHLDFSCRVLFTETMPIEEKRTLKPIPSPSGCGNSEKSRAPAGARPQAGGFRYGRWVGLDHQSKATQNKSSPGLSVERAYFKIRPGPDDMRVRAGHLQGKSFGGSVRAVRRVRGSPKDFCPQGASTPKRVLRTIQRGVLGAALRFLQAGTVPRCKNRLSARENAAGEGISVLRMQAEMGSPWSILTGGCRSGRCSPR